MTKVSALDNNFTRGQTPNSKTLLSEMAAVGYLV